MPAACLSPLDEAAARLKRLFHAPSPLPTKARVIQSGILPHAFFGTFNAAPGLRHIHRLRSLAARALVGRHHTMSAYAAMYIAPGVMDPEVFLLWSHAIALRRAFKVQPSTAEAVLTRLLRGPFTSIFGPATALRALLDRNGWCVQSSGMVSGPDHWKFNLKTSCSRSIAAAIEGAWACRVQAECCHRANLQHIELPCKQLTSKVLAHFQPWKQAIIARHMSGAFMSGAEKSTWSRLDCEFCALCGERDTKAHRVFTCTALNTVHELHRALLDTVSAEFPSWVHLTVARQHAEAPFFRLACHARQLPPVLPPLPCAGRIQLFSDGSAVHSSIPVARLTYWAVVASRVDGTHDQCVAWRAQSPAQQAANFHVLVQGCTPGVQTVPRAELSALAWTAKWLQAHPQLQVDLFTDSAFALSVWEHVSATGSVHGLKVDCDLAACLFPSSRMRVFKVKSHASDAVVLAAGPVQAWMYAGNHAADRAAKGARQFELEHMRRTSDDLAEHWQY